ncbi:hypothetical protein PtB15_3B168 [Puccinia triticina]|nr:hypothetical protein PtB15_3B168 [Puccinia triticina]
MLVKICWILCFVLAVVSALHPEAANAPDQPDCLHNTAKTTEPEARKQHFNPGISNGPGFNFASRKTNLEKRELLSVQMRKRIRKDLAAWSSKHEGSKGAIASQASRSEWLPKTKKRKLTFSSLSQDCLCENQEARSMKFLDEAVNHKAQVKPP